METVVVVKLEQPSGIWSGAHAHVRGQFIRSEHHSLTRSLRQKYLFYFQLEKNYIDYWLKLTHSPAEYYTGPWSGTRCSCLPFRNVQILIIVQGDYKAMLNPPYTRYFSFCIFLSSRTIQKKQSGIIHFQMIEHFRPHSLLIRHFLHAWLMWIWSIWV